jgi:hypothetical protein
MRAVPGGAFGKVHSERISWRPTELGVSPLPMNEAHIDLTSQDSTQEVPAADESGDDRLLTRRLPPMTPPPPRVASVPPSAPPPAFAPSGTYPANAGTQPGSHPRTSWWNALLAATFPPPSMAPAMPTDERVLRRRIGATCAGMALGFVILGLALGLRGSEPAYSPVVSAALVLSRSLVALGFLGFGYGLLRMAERLFTGMGASERTPTSNDVQ